MCPQGRLRSSARSRSSSTAGPSVERSSTTSRTADPRNGARRKLAQQTKRMQVFAGTSIPELAEGVVRHLGIDLGNVKIRKFANGEIYVRYLESVRGADVFIVQSICAPVNETLME